MGRCEIVFGSCIGSEGRTLYACRHTTLDVDNARPFEKQVIARERRVIQRHKRMEIADCGGPRLDPGGSDVCPKQCGRPVGGGPQIGGNVGPKSIKPAHEIKTGPTQVYPPGEPRKTCGV